MDDIEQPDDGDSIKIEIQIPKKHIESPPPAPVEHHIIHNVVNVVAPAPVVKPIISVKDRQVPPKVEPILKDATGEMKQKDEPGTLEKVRLHGSRLEKAAVNASQKFSYRGITVKDSRAS